jgi:hypothetical protein
MTSVSPDAARIWRAARAPVVIALIIIVGAVVLTLVRGDTGRGALDPGAAEPDGSRALAKLLEDQGVRIDTVRTLPDVQQALSGPATLLVIEPDLVDPGRLAELRSRAASTVLIGPHQQTLDRVLPGARELGDTGTHARTPDCTLSAAVAAGSAEVGGVQYRPPGHGRACYGGSLVSVGSGPGTTALGDGTALQNQHLATEGNAALTMRLLGEHPHLVWYLPSPSDPALRPGETALTSLIPPGWVFGAIQLAVAAALFALWRARRLGPVVTEPLPVVVRAAETTEGRARLYRRSGSMDHAAGILREAARERLRPALGLGAAAEPAALVEAAAARSGRGAAEVGVLLYGPLGSGGDRELVRLADALDELEREVTAS